MRKVILVALYFVLTVFIGTGIDYILSINRPINIYPIKAHTIISGDIRMEAFCVDNYRWKNEREIHDSILAYDARTVRKDSILKYKKLYRRTFLKNKGEINKNYNNRHDKEYVYYLPDYYLFTIYREVVAEKKVDIYISKNDKYYSMDIHDPKCWNKVINASLLSGADERK